MPQHLPLRPGDPGRVGRYGLRGRIGGIPAEDAMFIGVAPDGADVCVTLLGGDWARDAAARDRFAAEAAAARRVTPFCAARVLDAGLHATGAFLVSEYVPGPSLLELVEADELSGGHALTAAALGAATGLASIHQAGLVHGSFGPEYLIMPADGPPRVIEFAITPPYGSATPAADMLAWAQTVAFAAAERPATRPEDLHGLPEPLRSAVEACLHPQPAERPAAWEVVATLLGESGSPGPLGQSGPSAGLLAAAARQAERALARYRRDFPAAAAHRPDRPAAERRSGRRAARAAPGRRRGLLVGILLAATLTGAVIAYLELPGHHRPGSTPPAADATHTSPGTSPASSPSRGPVIPGAFSGTWSGPVSQPPADTYTVTVSVAAGATAGTIQYAGADFSCSGTLTLAAATPASITLSQKIVTGRSECGNGRVRLTILTARRTVRFAFRSAGPAAAGTLTRS